MEAVAQITQIALEASILALTVGEAIERNKQKNSHSECCCPHEDEVKQPTTKICPFITVPKPFYHTEEEMVSSRRCSLCNLYYQEKNNTTSSCIHHHGRYLANDEWTCCRDILKTAEGCCVGRHVEDIKTTKLLEEFEDISIQTGNLPPKMHSNFSPVLEKEGYMTKQGHIFRNWKRRFFKLFNGRLHYYGDKSVSAGPLGEIILKESSSYLSWQGNCAYLHVEDKQSDKEFIMYADSNEETKEWKQAIENVAQRYSMIIVGNSNMFQSSFNVVTPPTTLPSSPPFENFVPPSYDEFVTSRPLNPPTYQEATYPQIETPKDSEDISPGQHFVHPVLETDTLPGIALKYHTTVQAIKKINKMNSDHVFSRKFLLIPHDGSSLPIPQQESEEYKWRRKINKFMKNANIKDKEEAEFYLEEAQGDEDKALKQFKADLEWESQTKTAL